MAPVSVSQKGEMGDRGGGGECRNSPEKVINKTEDTHNRIVGPKLSERHPHQRKTHQSSLGDIKTQEHLSCDRKSSDRSLSGRKTPDPPTHERKHSGPGSKTNEHDSVRRGTPDKLISKKNIPHHNDSNERCHLHSQDQASIRNGKGPPSPNHDKELTTKLVKRNLPVSRQGSADKDSTSKSGKESVGKPVLIAKDMSGNLLCVRNDRISNNSHVQKNCKDVSNNVISETTKNVDEKNSKNATLCENNISCKPEEDTCCTKEKLIPNSTQQTNSSFNRPNDHSHENNHKHEVQKPRESCNDHNHNSCGSGSCVKENPNCGTKENVGSSNHAHSGNGACKRRHSVPWWLLRHDYLQRCHSMRGPLPPPSTNCPVAGHSPAPIRLNLNSYLHHNDSSEGDSPTLPPVINVFDEASTTSSWNTSSSPVSSPKLTRKSKATAPVLEKLPEESVISHRFDYIIYSLLCYIN